MFENYEAPQELRPTDPRFGCGPSLVPLEFIHKLHQEGSQLIGTSHRKAPIKNLCKGIQEGLREYFDVPSDYTICLGNGGATLLFDMIGLTAVDKKIAHFTCGEFSEKWFKSSQLIPWIDALQCRVEYGKGINGTNVSDADVIAVTLNETSTGVQLSQLPIMDDQTILAVDATSGAGQIPCDISKTDIFFFSPQKVFASEGGFFVAIISPKARVRVLKNNEDKTRYVPGIMNFKTCIDNSDKNQTYNTPSVSTLFFLNEQIKEMNKLGYQNIINEAQRKADLLYGWAKEKDYLSVYIEQIEFRSTAVACIDVNDKIEINALLKILGEKKIVYGIESYRKLGRNQFRIALFHNVTFDNLEKLTKLLSDAIEKEL
jgi:phosphoserine aminotransferase